MINLIVIINIHFITYDYYIFANVLLLAGYIQYSKILFIKYLYKDQSVSAKKYYKYLQKIVFLALYIISTGFTCYEEHYLAAFISLIISIICFSFIKDNWTEMQKDKEAMIQVSAK